MSWLSGLLAGNTGQPASRGGGPDAAAATGATAANEASAIAATAMGEGARLTLLTLRHPRGGCEAAGPSLRGPGARAAGPTGDQAGDWGCSTDGRASSIRGAPQCQQKAAPRLCTAPQERH